MTTMFLLQRLKEAGRQKRKMVPCIFTLLNAYLGFLGILAATEEAYGLVVICILLAVCMDVLDGYSARALGAATMLGKELDSLSDAISFCLLPSILFYCWRGAWHPVISVVVAFAYLAAGLVRLARFNSTDQSSRTTFCGLPTPAGALICALLIICNAPTAQGIGGVACAMVGVALLMISSLPFPSLK